MVHRWPWCHSDIYYLLLPPTTSYPRNLVGLQGSSKSSKNQEYTIPCEVVLMQHLQTDYQIEMSLTK